MSFRWADAATCAGRCSAAVIADGQIDDATPGAFRAFLDAAGGAARRPLVFLNSSGGKIVAAMELGQEFRAARATVVVAAPGDYIPQQAVCYSSCVYALMGAVRRIVPPGGQVGVHRIFAWRGDNRRYAGEGMTSMLRRYTANMGVSVDLVALAERVDPDHMRILTPSEMSGLRLASTSN
ncbi:hypothetical protein [Methylocella sp.]|uniref:hypothetical protein n=1 Tax=Methylocella sp. TaxID=1978226 RepID=UPI00378444BC